MKKRQIISSIVALIILTILTVGGIYRSRYITNPSHWGETMGTGYSIKLTGRVKKAQLEKLHESIERRLAEINRQMSTWDPESEISTFNHSDSSTTVPCSTEFAAVVQRALELSHESSGAFDPTLQPLLNLWGFGSESEEDHIPSDTEIEATLDKVGWQKISLTENGLNKSHPETSLALGAIAKGYGVDQVATILRESNLKDWFVEIGGEVVVSGESPQGRPWRIGIQNPSTNPMDATIRGIVSLSHGAIATSGDYRNYIEEDGVIYSHILDPRSGRTVKSDTASVTVFADNCMDADGIATALFVMGAEEGLAWVEQMPDVEALFLLRSDSGEIIPKKSSGFVEATGYIAEL